MNIAIYGDSYADPKKFNRSDNWMDILRNKYENVFSFGLSETNLFYSMNIFEKEYKKFDKNIFLITNPYRIWADRFNIMPPSHQFFAGSGSVKEKIELQKKFNRNLEWMYTNIKILESIEIYFAYVQNQYEEAYKQKLIIKEILSLDPDVLLIPCYDTSIENADGSSLFDIYLKENAAWGIDGQDIKSDYRNCHMTIENNKILADKIIDHLDDKTTFNLNINDFVTPMNKELYIR